MKIYQAFTIESGDRPVFGSGETPEEAKASVENEYGVHVVRVIDAASVETVFP